MLDPNRPNVSWDDAEGCWLIRASALGQCPKALALVALGETEDPLPAAVLKAFERGHDMESELLSRTFYGDDSMTRDYQYSVTWDVSKSVQITGTIDLCLLDSYGDVVALRDAKTTTELDSWKLVSKYRWQLAAYYHAIRVLFGSPRVELVVGRVESAAATELSNVSLLQISRQELPTVKQIKDKLSQMLTLINMGQTQGLEAMSTYGCVPDAFGCRMSRFHSLVQEIKTPAIEVPQPILEAMETLRKVHSFRSEHHITRSQEDDAKDALRTWAMAEAGLSNGDKMHIEGFELALSRAPEPKRTVRITPEELTTLIGAKKAAPYVTETTPAPRFTHRLLALGEV